MAYQNYLLYIAYGGPNFCDETIFSILTYLQLQPAHPTTAVLIYTDSADYFRPVFGPRPDIIYQEVPAAQWKEWRGKINFIHRAKVEVMRHAARSYQGAILYLDSDTVFLQDVAPVFKELVAGQHFMHIKESVLPQGNPLHRQLYKFLTQHPNPAWAAVSAATVMYNAGAIGFHSRDVPVLNKVLELTDILVQANPLHVMEQFAFSLVLAQARPVQEVAPYVLHYWHMKDVRPLLAEFLARHRGQPLAELLAAAAPVPVVELARKKDQWESTPRWLRGVLRAVGRGWKIDTQAILG